MSGSAVGWTLLVCVTVLGLGRLAVTGTGWDHAVARAFALVLAVLTVLVNSPAGGMLLLGVAGTDRLRPGASIPRHVPPGWSGLGAGGAQ